MNIYKVTGKNEWEFWLAENEEDAKQRFLDYFPEEEIVSCVFETKEDDAIFRSMTNGLVLRF